MIRIFNYRLFFIETHYHAWIQEWIANRLNARPRAWHSSFTFVGSEVTKVLLMIYFRIILDKTVW